MIPFQDLLKTFTILEFSIFSKLKKKSPDLTVSPYNQLPKILKNPY